MRWTSVELFIWQLFVAFYCRQSCGGCCLLMGIVQPSQSTILLTLRRAKVNGTLLNCSPMKRNPSNKKKENLCRICSYLRTHCTWGIIVGNEVFHKIMHCQIACSSHFDTVLFPFGLLWNMFLNQFWYKYNPCYNAAQLQDKLIK